MRISDILNPATPPVRKPVPPPAPQPMHYAILIDFEDLHLFTAIEALDDTLRAKPDWKVFRISLTRRKNLQQRFEDNINEFIKVSKNPRDKFVVYYGGHAIQNPEGEYASWYWNAKPDDGCRCFTHLTKVDPAPIFRNLCLNTDRDLLFILHAPFLRETSGLIASPNGRPDRKIDVWHFPVPVCGFWDKETHEEYCEEEECESNELVRAKEFSKEPTRYLRRVLEGMGRMEEVEDLARVRFKGEGVVKSEVVRILGDGVVLGRG